MPMITSRLGANTSRITLAEKVKLVMELLKVRLSLLVVFSAAFGFLLANQGPISWISLIGLCVGGFLTTGASIILNQIIEKDSDKLMQRTQNRPLPTSQIQVEEAQYLGIILGIIGFFLLLITTNSLTAILSLFSLVLYAFIYTPLKKIGPIAVIVGAIPGAFPPLLGWVAVRGELGFEAFIIFLIQFVWQFPHFWAIAWVMDEDYRRAGIKLLPSQGGRDFSSAFQIFLCTLFLIPVGILPTQLGITGNFSLVAVTICSVLFLIPTIQLMRDGSRKSALRVMFGSFIYLPLTQIFYLIDKL